MLATTLGAAIYGNATNDAVVLFLSMLAILCQVFLAIVIASRVLGIWVTPARNLYESIANNIGPVALPVAFLVALVTMSGSLYFSEVIHWRPCNLCWYQRILIYSMVPILGLATLRRDVRIWPYGVLLAAICLPISTYHYLLEWYPQLETSVCSLDVPCTAVYLRKFNYLSIPLMAGTCAATVLTLLLLARRSSSQNDSQE